MRSVKTSSLTGIHSFDDPEGEDPRPIGTDKAATPAERVLSEGDLSRRLDAARPLVLAAQRDSDAARDVQEARINALGQFAELDLHVGSALEPQFRTDYPSRVFSPTLPWCVGGPGAGGGAG